MNNEYPNEYPQDTQGYNPAAPAQAPVPPVVDAPAAEPYYQVAPAYQVPSAQGYPAQNYPNQGYPNQGYANQGYPNQGYPNQGYPNQPPYAPPADYYAQPNYYAPAAEEKPAAVWKVFAIFGLIFGILGLALCWVPVVNIYTTAMAIFGIVFSALGKKSRSGVATAGLVLSIIGTVLGLILSIAFGSVLMIF